MLHFLGLILIAIAGVLSLPTPVAFMYGELEVLPFFLIPAIISFTLGFVFQRKCEEEEMLLGDAMVVVAATWVIIAFFGAIPYYFTSSLGFLDSFFESMSGFTATGLTVMQGFTGWEIAEPCHTVLFWRSLTQWVGGLGVIVLFLALFPGTSAVARKLYASEAREGRIMPSMRGTAQVIWRIYLLFTLLGVVGLYLTGMRPFTAVNHSMTGIATGGFTVVPTSYATYNSSIFAVTIIIMIFGGISFMIHRKFLGGDWRALFESIEVKFMLLLIGIAALALGWKVGLRHGIFQTTSALTGTGFSSTGFVPRAWGAFQKSVLTVLMVVGGGYGSTSSAIKLIRTLTILYAVYWIIKRSFLPDRAVVPLKVGGQVYDESDVMEAAVYGFIYIILLTVGALITMHLMPNWTGVEALFESASAQGNVGLSVGLTVSSTAGVKILFIIQMLAGRLEIIPVVSFLSFLLRKLPSRREPF